MIVLFALIRNLVEKNEMDVRLIERIVKRDQTALAELYDRYASLIYTLILRIVKSAEAEDLLQDVFLQVWNKAHRFVDAKGSVYTWIVTIARNKAIDHTRGANRIRRSELLPEDVIVLLGDETAKANPFVATMASEYEQLMQNALATLAPDQRRVIELSYYEGFTQTQISDQLNVPLGTVKTRMRQGMIRLRDFLKERIEK